MEYLIYFLISLAISAVAYMIAPKPSVPDPAVQELNLPTAEAGKPKNVVFGEVLVKSPNYLWFGAKDKNQRKSDRSIRSDYYTNPTGLIANGHVNDYPTDDLPSIPGGLD